MDALPDHFGESAAATYDEDCSEMFDDEVVARTVDVLADLYRTRGFYQATIGAGYAVDTPRSEVVIMFEIVEGVSQPLACVLHIRADYREPQPSFPQRFDHLRQLFFDTLRLNRPAFAHRTFDSIPAHFTRHICDLIERQFLKWFDEANNFESRPGRFFGPA